MSTRQPGCFETWIKSNSPKSRERPRFHSLVKTCQGLQNAPLAGEEGARKFRTKIPVHAQQILKHQYLSVTSAPAADADGRNTKAFTNFPGKVRWHALEHDETPQVPRERRLPGDISRESLFRPVLESLHRRERIEAAARHGPHRDALWTNSLNYILMSVHASSLTRVRRQPSVTDAESSAEAGPFGKKEMACPATMNFARCAATTASVWSAASVEKAVDWDKPMQSPCGGAVADENSSIDDLDRRRANMGILDCFQPVRN